MSDGTADIAIQSMHREYVATFSDDAVAAVRARLDPSRTFVVCDERVHELWGEYLEPLAGASPGVRVSPTEESKTIRRAEALIETMVDAGVRRDHTVLAIGGGITQDVTAFAASILYRGIAWAFIPTTLLAQADSCIGSKSSINVGDKKNLAGTFWPPAFAAIDTRFLDTLPDADIRSGIGEMLHFYLYADSPKTRQLIAERASLLADRARLRPYIRESLLIKRDVVERDECDRGERHKFNYGHTFGHALESLSGYTIPHGEAVTVGMDVANFVSTRTGLMPRETFDDLHTLLAANFPARPAGEIDLARYCGYLAKDKKNLGRTVGCILAERPGALVAKQLPLDDDFRSILREYFAGPWWRA